MCFCESEDMLPGYLHPPPHFLKEKFSPLKGSESMTNSVRILRILSFPYKPKTALHRCGKVMQMILFFVLCKLLQFLCPLIQFSAACSI